MGKDEWTYEVIGDSFVISLPQSDKFIAFPIILHSEIGKYDTEKLARLICSVLNDEK